jgi:hypothetical protein
MRASGVALTAETALAILTVTHIDMSRILETLLTVHVSRVFAVTPTQNALARSVTHDYLVLFLMRLV